MKKYRLVGLISLLVIFAASMFFFLGSPAQSAGGPSFTPQGHLMRDEARVRKIVVFEAGADDNAKKGIVEGAGAKVVKKLGLINAVVIHLPDQASDKAREAIQAHALVVRIDDDLVIEALPKPPSPPGKDKNPGDEEQPPQTISWGVDRIDADNAWATSTGSGVRVAIMDSGIDEKHPDLAANIMGGINEINPRKSFNDDNGHGTHVAGIVAAINNDIGVVGVAPQAHLYGVKVLDRSGNGWLSDIIDGLDWCIKNDMQVINMSFGSAGSNQSFKDAVSEVYEAGIIQVAAAGNESSEVIYPAKYPEVIAVSAVDENNAFAYWSNSGPEIDLAAPGVGINSTYKGGTYKIASGTSMSTPHVTGAVALKLQLISLGPDAMRTALKNSAEDIGLPINEQGAGLVDAENLLNY